MNYDLSPPLTDREREVAEELRSRINVANVVATARVRLGLTQEELGRRAGTKQSRISELEGLQGNLRFDTLDRIARALGLMVTLVPRVETLASASAITTALPYRGLRFSTTNTGEYAVSMPKEWKGSGLREVSGV